MRLLESIKTEHISENKTQELRNTLEAQEFHHEQMICRPQTSLIDTI